MNFHVNERMNLLTCLKRFLAEENLPAYRGHLTNNKKANYEITI